jgi:demethylmenaquinone methyltransferase/2-methoxy-6-polyprenyl-1,4-benzoquinol methylase
MSNNISLSTRIYDPLLSGALKPLRKAVTMALPIDKNTRILDLCCGTGDQLLTLEMAGYTNLHGLDLNPDMIAYAKQKSTSISFHEGDAANTGLPEASFDVITISLALHDKNQNLRESILKEIARLLKPTGFALAADFCFDDKTKFMGRFLITAVETFAGGEHFYNFKDYIQRVGMKTILPEGMFDVEEVARVLKNAIGVWKLSKH